MKDKRNNKIQIFILGSSSSYGVGAEKAGWADLVKQEFHQKMYSRGGIGEKCEIYNFSKSGATIDFVKKTFPFQLKNYGRGGKIVVITSIGRNNAKAKNDPKNYISSIKKYGEEISQLFDLLKKKSDQVIVVGGGFCDESKTNPKFNPLTGGKSYFTNERMKKFENFSKKLCEEKGILFIDINVAEETWKKKYLFEDGLHSNQKGHEFIAKKILGKINK